MWEHGLEFSVGCVLMVLVWVCAVGLIGVDVVQGRVTGWGHAGLGLSALAASLTIMWDNSKTRRVVRSLRRSGEVRSL